MLNPILNSNFKISQKFWWNFSMYRRFNIAWHNWTDFACPIWTPIFSPIDWIVKNLDYQPCWYWKFIRIWNEKIEIIFAHLSNIGIKINQKIKSWDYLWLTWNTWFSTWAHLHFWIRFLKWWNILNYNNWFLWYLDPIDYFISWYFDKKLIKWKISNNNNINETPEWAKEAKKFVIEEWISNWERPLDFITREEFWLILFRCLDILNEDWHMDNKDVIDFDNLDISNKPSEWAQIAYTFVVSEWISNWERPKEFTTKEEVLTMLFIFFKDYSQFKSWNNIKIDESVSDWAKDSCIWSVINWISNNKNLKEFTNRAEIWVMLMRCIEIIED